MNKTFLVVGIVSFLACAGEAAVVVYPEYPAAIERDDAYEVSVADSSGSHRLTVYNRCEKSILEPRTHGGDVNRRFCEFAFEGEPVTVNIAVKRDVSCYKVFPVRLGLKHSFKDGVISVTLPRPEYFGIQLNDSDKTILSVFADEPEKDAPKEGTPGVLYVKGWVDAPSADGVLKIEKGTREIYLAPGSVLNARIAVVFPRTYLHGRGMILDPMSDVFRYDQKLNKSRGLLKLSAEGCRVDGIKLVDARTFNICSWGAGRGGVRVTNVKILSSMMCSDGITAGGRAFVAEHDWIYCGDNALVVSGAKNATFRRITIGTSCKAIFPQDTNKNACLEDIDVFRADEGLIENVYNGTLRRNNKWSEMSTAVQKKERDPQDLKPQANEFHFSRLSAVDCTLFSYFFHGANMGYLPKTFSFDQLSIPHAAGRGDWRLIGKTDGKQVLIRNDPKRYLMTSNYTITVTNLYLAGSKVAGFAPEVIGSKPPELMLSVVSTDAPCEVPLHADRTVVNWTCPLARRQAPANCPSNLLEDRPSSRSIWQRVPSWLVKFDATTRDEKGAVIYRLTQCERNAGMQAVITDRYRVSGPGRYRLSFACCATNATPFDLRVEALSNEKTVKQKLPHVVADGTWRNYALDLDLDFPDPAFDLLSIKLVASLPTSEILFRNISLVKER